MKRVRNHSRKGFLALNLAVMTVGPSVAVRANTLVTFEQNANGQAYFYTAPNGATISGNYPSDNNWSQSLTYGTYMYTVGNNTVSYPYEIAPSNWSIDTYPNSTSDDIYIPGLPVTLDVSVSIGNLNISSGGVINMNNSQTLEVAGTTLIDNGKININPGQSGGATILTIDNATVSGLGSINLGYALANAQLDGIVTQSAGHSITGEGELNAALTNNGTVNANYNGGTLYLQTNNMVNNSLFEATGGGTLYVNGISVSQGTNAQILAGTSSPVSFYGATVTGGMLNSSAGSAITNINGTTTLNSITNNATLNLLNGTGIVVTGNLVDSGTININPFQSGGVTFMNMSGGTVSGTGSIVLGYANNNAVLNGSLTQSAGHTIKGEGQINAALTNNGTVNANYNGGTLYLQTSNMSNNSLFEATGGGVLEIDNINITQSAAGLISIGTSSTGNLNGANISGGTINTSAGTYFTVSGNITTLASLTSNATFRLPNSNQINITGNMVDNGQILVNPFQSGGATILNISGGTISGTGNFNLGYSSNNAQLNGSLTQSASHSITGEGQVNALLVNNGVVNANANGQTLYVQTLSPTATDTNNAVFEATNGGTLEMNGITVNQSAAGVMNAASGSTVNLTNSNVAGGTINLANNSTMVLSNSVVSAATLTGASGATIYVQGGAPSSIGSVLNNPAGSYINVVNSSTLNITGTLIDNGTIAINPAQNGGTTILNFSGGTITGSGDFYLGYANNNAQLDGTLTQPTGHTISGEGYVNAALTNNGTVNANYSGGTLFLQNSNMSNSGLFEATGGGTLYINAIGVTQTGAGQILAGTNSTVQLNAVTISGGMLNSSTGSTITTVTGTTTLNSITNNATLNLLNSTGIVVTGNLVDNGTINVNPFQNGGYTFMNVSGGTVSGTGSIVLGYAQNNATLNGTLTQSAGHTIKGEGEITAALTNNGTVNANVNGQTLYLQTSNMSNNSLFEATGGGVLEIDGIAITQPAGGLISIGTGSTANLNGATISGGTINSASGTYFTQNGTPTTLASLTSNAAIRELNSTTINITGNIVDNGQIIVNPNQNGGATILNFSGGTISGTGNFYLNYSSNNAQLNGSLTQSAGHTIFGQGQINALLINNGTVNANVSGQTLYINNSVTNNGTFEATNGGALDITAGTVNSSAGTTVTGTITVDSGAQLIENGAITGAPALTVGGVVLFNANPNTGILNRSLTSLALTGSGLVTIAPATNHSNRTLLTTGALTFAGSTNNWNGKLEDGNNDIIIHNGVLGDLTNQLKQGFNNGTWQGSAGITSSTAAANTTHLTTLGILLNGTTYGTANGSLGTFDGTNPTATDVLIKYTYFGDANLDGKVDGSDYTKIDSGFVTHATGWSNGDFNYDGVINGSDYTLIDNAFNTQGTNLSNTAEIATASSQLAGPSVVPEPASTVFAVLGGSTLLARRRRRA